ncbi:unnamed protein product [Penicillium salamii]|nr:unnamed protein product [Penicillium salamii]
MADILELTHVKLQSPTNGVALISLNKPDSGNSLHPVLLSDALKAVRWANQQPSIKVIILSGNGRFFCTGMELASEEEISFALGDDFHQLNKEFIISEKILIAAVNGAAVGYGSTCIGLFDLVFAVEEAYFFLPLIKWAFLPEGAASLTYPRIMGHQRASLLFLTGQRISAAEAQQLGLVSRILPTENFIKEVTAIAEEINQSDSNAVRETKKMLRQPVVQDLLDANDRECQMISKDVIARGHVKKAREKFQLGKEKKSKQKQAKSLL